MAQQPGRGWPPAAGLAAAIAALPAKKAALREAFDHLAACSPYPLPFTWEQLDAHISEIQSSISQRFRQLRVLEAARPAHAVSAPAETRGNEKGKNQGEEEEEEEEEVEAEEEVEEVEEEEEVEEVEEEADEEMQEADDKIGKKTRDEEEAEEEMQEDDDEEEEEEQEEAKKESSELDVDEVEEVEEEEEVEEVVEEEEVEEEEEEADEEMQEADDKIDAKTRDEEEDDEEEEEEEQEAEEDNDEEQVTKNIKRVSWQPDVDECEKVEEAEKMTQKQLNWTPPGGSEDLVAACASMDATMLVKFVCCNSPTLGKYFPIAMRHAPDAALLVLQVVKLFLSNKKFMTIKVWVKCIGLIRCVPAAAAKPSADTIEQAKRVAKDWKDMIDKARRYGEHGVLASWGLLYFLISYNIVSEFDTNEIIRLFSTVPRKQQKINTVELCKSLGLADRITDLVDYLIGNGQQLDAVHLAHVFNLVDKYPPLSLLKGYLEKAKRTVMAIFGKNMTRKSQIPVIAKEVDSLRVAQNVVKQHITDSRQCSIVLAEIKNLLDEYAKKKEGLANASTASTSKSQQQQKQSNKKRKKEEQEHNKGQESQQKWQQSKPGQKLEQKQNKPQQKKQQQRKQENKPQEAQQQHLK